MKATKCLLLLIAIFSIVTKTSTAQNDGDVGTTGPLPRVYTLEDKYYPNAEQSGEIRLLEKRWNSGKYGMYMAYNGNSNVGTLGMWNGSTRKPSINIERSSGRVHIGTLLDFTNSSSKYLLTVDGTIHARGLAIAPTKIWADFVFNPCYQLTPLSEVESFIQTNGHLSEIPSAQEVEANGYNQEEMNAKLLQKIEELTLYVIELEKKVNAK